MTTTIEATYECDRCHTQVKTNGDDPEGWHDFKIRDWSTIPLSDMKGHLCAACTGAVKQFIQSNPNNPYSNDTSQAEPDRNIIEATPDWHRS